MRCRAHMCVHLMASYTRVFLDVLRHVASHHLASEERSEVVKGAQAILAAVTGLSKQPVLSKIPLTTELRATRQVLLRTFGDLHRAFCFFEKGTYEREVTDATLARRMSITETVYAAFMRMLSIAEFDNEYSPSPAAFTAFKEQSDEQFLSRLRRILLYFNLPHHSDAGFNYPPSTIADIEWETAARLDRLTHTFAQFVGTAHDTQQQGQQQQLYDRDRCTVLSILITRLSLRAWAWLSFLHTYLFPKLASCEASIQSTAASLAPALNLTALDARPQLRANLIQWMQTQFHGMHLDSGLKSRLRDFMFPFVCGAGALIDHARERRDKANRDSTSYISKASLRFCAPQQHERDRLQIDISKDLDKLIEQFNVDQLGELVAPTHSSPHTTSSGPLDLAYNNMGRALCTLFLFCYLMHTCARLPFFSYDDALSGLEMRGKPTIFCGPWQFPDCLSIMTMDRPLFRSINLFPSPRLACVGGLTFVTSMGTVYRCRPITEDPLHVCLTWLYIFHYRHYDIGETGVENVIIRERIWTRTQNS